MSRALATALALAVCLSVVMVVRSGDPVFLYHSGAVATSPGEVLTLRFYYRDSGVLPTRVAVSSFVGEGCEGLEVLGSRSRRGILPGSLGLIEVRVRAVREGDSLLRAAVAKWRGGEATIPIGQVELVSKSVPVTDVQVIALRESTLMVPERTAVAVSVPLMSEATIEMVMPEPPLHSRVVIGPPAMSPGQSTYVSTWRLELQDSLWMSPSCFLFRPVVRTVSEGESTTELGPLIEVVTKTRG